MATKTLKNYINNEDFIQKMNSAFSDLRADYELSMDADKQKIKELQSTHVDVKNQLTDLVTYSLSSSGVVSGLRGTGKTHLLLLARNRINENCFSGNTHGVLCVYLNVKRLNFPEKLDQELFNRVFCVFLYSEISKQLTDTLGQLKDDRLLHKFFNFFKSDKDKASKNLQAALLKIFEFKQIACSGNSEFHGLSIGKISQEADTRELEELTASLGGKLGFSVATIDSKLSSQSKHEVSDKLAKSSTYLNYLNINTIHEELIQLMQLLNLKGMTFYVDEWEKLSYNMALQRHLAFFIDRILDDPIYFWISIVPYRGHLYALENGSDLQHFIDLDENLIFENSTKDHEICLAYFREFINKRLLYYFKNDEIDIALLFNNNNNFEKLVLASMGNSRDFGTMLLKCWSEFQTYRTGHLNPGRPFQYISEDMVVTAIKNNGEKKLSNISSNANVQKVWNDIETFCISKKSSHFAIEENQSNIKNLSQPEFSDLIYHRLIHLRKKHVPAKDTSVENKLSIYALNYTSIYDLHASEKKLKFINDYTAVHDRVRRYIYDPTKMINRIQIQEGQMFPCNSCGELIDTQKMAAAWSANSCPYCGNSIRSN